MEQEQLVEEREARRRADTIIVQLTQTTAALAFRVPELEAPRGPGRAESVPESSGGDVVPEDRENGSERPWWRRMFGG